jgi:hypothetical protein
MLFELFLLLRFNMHSPVQNCIIVAADESVYIGSSAVTLPRGELVMVMAVGHVAVAVMAACTGWRGRTLTRQIVGQHIRYASDYLAINVPGSKTVRRLVQLFRRERARERDCGHLVQRLVRPEPNCPIIRARLSNDGHEIGWPWQ